MYDRDLWRSELPGMRQQTIEGPLEVYQRDRLIGTVPSFPVRSTSGIFDVRPSDFTPEQRDGKTVLKAANMIGPGDFACIEGFTPAAGVPDCYGDRSTAQMFDALAAAGGSRADAMEALLGEMLKPPR